MSFTIYLYLRFAGLIVVKCDQMSLLDFRCINRKGKTTVSSICIIGNVYCEFKILSIIYSKCEPTLMNFCFGIFHICKLVKLSKQTINPNENLNIFSTHVILNFPFCCNPLIHHDKC